MTGFLDAGIGSSGVDVGDIGHSLRCRSAANVGVSKTYSNGVEPADSSFYKKFYSVKTKRGKLGAIQILFGNAVSSANLWTVYFDAADKLVITSNASGSVLFTMTSDAVFRDPTSWLFLDFQMDGTLATAADRLKVYKNGVQLTFTGTYPPQNNSIGNMFLGGALGTWIGYFGNRGYDYGTYPYDGYLARLCCVDDPSGVTPSSFGYFNTEINEWVSKSQAQVKAVVDAGGTNSFMLDFDNGTSLTTLGYDNSSKGNNWTLNNFSLTAGVTYDWMLDVPGNSYAVLNPLKMEGYTGVLDYANLRITTGGGNGGSYNRMGTIAVDDKVYYEQVVFNCNLGGSAGAIGFSLPENTIPATQYVGQNSSGFSFVPSNATWGKTVLGAVFSTTGMTLSGVVNGDVLGIAFDPKTGNAWISKNGTWNGTGNPTTGANPDATGTPTGKSWLPASAAYNSGGIVINFDVNFGQRPFAYTPPTGFKALCQANLPEVAIKNPERHMDVVLATGANIKTTSEAVFPSNFLEWIKDRANSNNHQLIDTVRGTSAVLQSNTTAAETTYSAPSGTSVGWLWKAGGAAVTNNAGSISSQVSANVEAGFSIATFTAPASGAFSIGHGLNSAPKLVIVKNRSGVGDWTVYGKFVTGPNYYLALNTTQAVTSATGVWSPEPTSGVVSMLAGSTIAASAQGVAYCFAEIHGFSKIGSYTGAASATGDGPNVVCGFKPKFLMGKRTDVAGPWFIVDGAREPTNRLHLELQPNSAYIENNATDQDPGQFDFTSNGFKVRTLSGDTNSAYTNATGGTYIFIAFADVSAKYSLAR